MRPGFHTMLLAVLLPAITAVALSPAIVRAAEEGRKVKLAWKPVEGISRFELQVSKAAKMDPEFLRKQITGSEVELHLEPGTYYFRVRGMDSSGDPGPWAEVQGFVVTAKPPELKSPDDAKAYEKAPDGGIALEWDGQAGPQGFLLEIWDAKGSVLKRTVTDKSFSWKPQAPGTYHWKIGVESPTRTDWSPSRSFEIKAAAIAAAAPTSFAVAMVEENQDQGVPPSWSVIGRAAQAILAYSNRDQDLGISASGAGLVSLLSAELRYRGRRAPDNPWLLSGSANFEMINQTVLNTGYSLPRFYGRVYYTKGRDAWRVGPFLHLGMGKTGIFIAQGPTQARSATVSRTSMGLGGVAVYQTSPNAYLSAIALLRMDSGGEAATIPSALSSSMGYEVGFGGVLQLTSVLMLEGRLRGVAETSAWKPSSASGESFQKNTFIILDLGLGYRF